MSDVTLYPARPGKLCQNFSGSTGENESDPRLGSAGAGQTSFYPGLAAGSPGPARPARHCPVVTCHIHSQNIPSPPSGQNTLGPAFHSSKQHESGHQITVNVASTQWWRHVSRLRAFDTPIKFIQISLDFVVGLWVRRVRTKILSQFHTHMLLRAILTISHCHCKYDSLLFNFIHS